MIGPLVSFDDIDRMIEGGIKSDSDMDSYIENNRLLAPDTEETYQEFKSAFETMEGRAEQVAREREEKKHANKMKATQKKLARIATMISDLEQLIDESFRELMLKCHQKEFAARTKNVSKRPVVNFDVLFVDVLFKSFVITPSKLQ